ncbi:ABC transporter permease [Ornithinimicrobium cavernae]|uniref:ABC transporter permease n=1 Tax=Ornithinimicrobium cavernae TaxID=2666047 RepID=UPI000D69B985|nr:ABC transporter permease [Ornithinimicrobium cavernae]
MATHTQNPAPRHTEEQGRPARRQKPVDAVPLWLKAVGVLVAIYLILPTLVVIPMSFSAGATFQFPPQEWSLRWYESFFTDERWLRALSNSLKVAVSVMVVATLVGTAAALGLSKSRGRWAEAVRSFLMLPLVAPGIVIAVVVYIAYLNWQMVGSFWGYLLIHTAMALPFVLVSVTASLSGFDANLLRAASSLGANPLRAFWRVQLPLILPGVLSGAVFAFVTSLDEVVVALFIRSPLFETLPVRMFNSVTIEIDPTVAAASSILVVLATLFILTPQLFRLVRRKK